MTSLPSPSTCTSIWRARFDELLEIEAAVAEGGLAPRPAPAASGARTPRPSRAMRMPRPPPPAAALIITGKPICSASGERRLGEFHDAPSAARNGRHARLLPPLRGRRPCRPSGGSSRAVGPDEDEPGRLDRGGELGILGKKAIAGMDGVGAGRPGRGENGVAVEIGFRRLRGTDVDRLRRRAARPASPCRPCCRPAPSRCRAPAPRE